MVDRSNDCDAAACSLYYEEVGWCAPEPEQERRASLRQAESSVSGRGSCETLVVSARNGRRGGPYLQSWGSRCDGTIPQASSSGAPAAPNLTAMKRAPGRKAAGNRGSETQMVRPERGSTTTASIGSFR